MMKTLLPIDELNRLSEKVKSSQYNDTNTGKRSFLLTEEEISEEILEFLTMSYTLGAESASNDLEIPIDIDSNKLTASIYRSIKDKTWMERIKEHYRDGDAEAIVRVADTEMVRDFNEGGYDTATSQKAKINKIWHTMGDDRVRDTHEVLNGTSKPLNDAFFTIDGDSSMMPGGFTAAENNVGCRCWLTYKKV